MINKLLQHMMDAGDVSHKFLMNLPKAQEGYNFPKVKGKVLPVFQQRLQDEIKKMKKTPLPKPMVRQLPFETIDARKKAFNTIRPSGYDDVNNYTRFLFNNKREEFEDPRSEEAFKLYLGLENDPKYFKKSRYAPTQNPTPGQTYFSADPEMEQDIFDAYSEQLKPNERRTVNESSVPSYFSEDTPGLFEEVGNQWVANTPIDKNLILGRPYNSRTHALGQFTVSRGSDKKGDYISYYDQYDFPEKMQEQMKGDPYKIYGRMYYPKKQMGGGQYFADGGDYKGQSIVDYLSTKGYSGKKAFRKELASKYGVEDYDYSAAKNIELLNRMRDNDDLLETYEQNTAPVSAERIEQIYKQNIAAKKQENFNNIRRRMSLEMGYDPFVEQPQFEQAQYPDLSLGSKNPYGDNSLVNGLQGTGQPLPVAPSPNRKAELPTFAQQMPRLAQPATPQGRPLIAAPVNRNYGIPGWDSYLQQPAPQKMAAPAAPSNNNVELPTFQQQMPRVATPARPAGRPLVLPSINKNYGIPDPFGQQQAAAQQKASPAPASNNNVKLPGYAPPVVEQAWAWDEVPDPASFSPFERFPAYPDQPAKVPTAQPAATPDWRYVQPGKAIPQDPLQQFPAYSARQISDLPKKTTAEAAAKSLEENINEQSWYEKTLGTFLQDMQNTGLDWGAANIGGAGFNPEGAKAMSRDITKNFLSVLSEDLAEKYQNKMERQDAKLNPKERKSSLDPSKVKFDPVYATGDTIADTKRRYHIPEVMDLDYMRFGVRNRGDYKELQTEGAPVTTFEPFQNAKQYFAKSKDPANATYIGVSNDGRIKVGGKDQFQNEDYQITRTYGNKVVDFNRDTTGSISKVPSNPKASKETLSPSVKVIDDNGKVVDGKLSLLLPRTGNQEESYDLVTGGRYIFQTPDGKTKLVSGSLKNIETEFYNIKKKNPYVNVITLDNGSYARGIRTYDKKLTKQDLKGYDNQNTGGGNFAYILPGDRKSRYDSKFLDFESEAQRKLQSLYPGKKVSVGFQNTGLYDETGGRDIESQVAIQKKGNSQTPVSLHNFGAAKDYILYVDGKAIDADSNKKIYKDVLWSAADKTGLSHLEDWDPTHISLAKEGQKTAFDELYSKYPDIFSNPNFARSLGYVNRNKKNPLYEEYFELLNNIQPFTGKPRTTEVMKKTTVKKNNGGPIIDPRGQWAHPGKNTMVPTPTGQITMQGVPYPVYGEDETGYGQMMYPGVDYQYPGQMVYETPMMQNGGLLSRSVTCSSCGHSWKSVEGGMDPLTCHKCGGMVKMKNGGQHGGLDRWFAEKWVDVKTGKDCGRQEGESRAGYPACRPSKRVSSQTPKTSSEMSAAEKAKFKRNKTSSERINYNHKRN